MARSKTTGRSVPAAAEAEDVEIIEGGEQEREVGRTSGAQARARQPVAQRYDDPTAEGDDEAEPDEVDEEAEGGEGEADDEEGVEEEDEAESDADEIEEEIDYDELVELRQTSTAYTELEKQMKKLQKELKAAQGRVDEFETAQLTEQQRVQKELKAAQKRATELEGDLRTTRLSAAIGRSAARLKVDPGLAERLMGAEIQFDEDGQPQNVEQALRALIQEHPYLAQGGQGGSAPTNGAKRNGRDARSSVMTLEDVEGMEPDEINDNWDTVSRLLSQVQ